MASNPSSFLVLRIKTVKLCVLTLIFVPYCNIASQATHTHPLVHKRPSRAPFLMRANLVIYLQDRSSVAVGRLWLQHPRSTTEENSVRCTTTTTTSTLVDPISRVLVAAICVPRSAQQRLVRSHGGLGHGKVPR